jgi:anaerobic magnesium-protoporphyrin IX monomethyl ester cyclase
MGRRMRIVLLNPPGKKTYLRGYFCGQTSKADYLLPPVDFIYIHARLRRKHEVHVLDAILERRSPRRVIARLRELRPDAIVFLSGMVSQNEDFSFLRALHEACPCRMIGLGDIFHDRLTTTLREHPFITAAALDFMTDEVERLLSGSDESARTGICQPVPDHAYWARQRYRHPFVLSDRFTVVLTDIGCPHQCTFCIMGRIPYRLRPLDNVLEELDSVAAAGIRDVVLLDQSFDPGLPRTRRLCETMIERRYSLRWVSYMRPDAASDAGLRLMKKAGCHTVIFGVESGSEELLREYRKGYTLDDIREAFDLARRAGLRTAGTFLLGGPRETRETCMQTIRLSCALPCDFASFNVFTPRPGTELYSQALAEGLLHAGAVSDQSGSAIAVRTRFLSSDDLLTFKRMAVRSFYGRPGYLLRQMRQVRSLSELKIKLRSACALAGNNRI